jgi:hypothetical protein
LRNAAWREYPPTRLRTEFKLLVVTAVSSINTRRVVSSQPCSRIQRRRARATSARLRSSARRLFFKRDAVARKESRQCAAARRDTSLTQYRNELCKIPLLADKVENLLRMLLQRGCAASTGHRFGRPIFAKALQPADRGTRADLEVFGSIPSRSSCFDELDHANSQIPRIRSPHWPAPRRINFGQPCVGKLGPAFPSTLDHLGVVPVPRLWTKAICVHCPHGQHDMGIGFWHAILADVPMHVEIGDHPQTYGGRDRYSSSDPQHAVVGRGAFSHRSGRSSRQGAEVAPDKGFCNRWRAAHRRIREIQCMTTRRCQRPDRRRGSLLGADRHCRRGGGERQAP